MIAKKIISHSIKLHLVINNINFNFCTNICSKSNSIKLKHKVIITKLINEYNYISPVFYIVYC